MSSQVNQSTSSELDFADCLGFTGISEAANSLYVADLSPQQFFSKLYRQERFSDAVRLVPWIMPIRQSIWWATFCLWEAYRPEPSQLTSDTLAAIVGWVVAPRPSEDQPQVDAEAVDQETNAPNSTELKTTLEQRRRLAGELGAQCGKTTPVGLLATAVFFSGGSVSLPGLPDVAPTPQQPRKLVDSAVMSAANVLVKQRHKKPFASFVGHAIRTSREELPWTIQGSDPETASVLGINLSSEPTNPSVASV